MRSSASWPFQSTCLMSHSSKVSVIDPDCNDMTSTAGERARVELLGWLWLALRLALLAFALP
jgi:hypothetical protein